MQQRCETDMNIVKVMLKKEHAAARLRDGPVSDVEAQMKVSERASDQYKMSFL